MLKPRGGISEYYNVAIIYYQKYLAARLRAILYKVPMKSLIINMPLAGIVFLATPMNYYKMSVNRP